MPANGSGQQSICKSHRLRSSNKDPYLSRMAVSLLTLMTPPLHSTYTQDEDEVPGDDTPRGHRVAGEDDPEALNVPRVKQAHQIIAIFQRVLGEKVQL